MVSILKRSVTTKVLAKLEVLLSMIFNNILLLFGVFNGRLQASGAFQKVHLFLNIR